MSRSSLGLRLAILITGLCTAARAIAQTPAPETSATPAPSEAPAAPASASPADPGTPGPAQPGPADAPLIDLTGSEAVQNQAPAPAVPPSPAPAPPSPAPAAPSASVPEPPPSFAPPPPTPPLAEPPARNNAVNLSVLGFLLGRVRLTYERFLSEKHAVFAEGLFTPDVLGGFDFVGYGGAVGYRWHWKGSGTSGFVGAVVALEQSEGSLTVLEFGDEETYEYRGRVLGLTVAPHIGKRWVFRSGLNITLRVGFGFAPVLSNKPRPGVDPKAVDIVDSRMIGTDGEASIGYSF